MMRAIRKVLAVAGACFVFVSAHAWDGANTGVPGLIEVTHGQNYGFRVYFTSPVAMCGPSSHGWAYLASADSNYSTYVAVILMAKAQGTPVVVYTTREPDGFCRIGHLAAH